MRIFIDNTTAVAYINNMGGTHSLERNHIARRFGCGVLNAIFAFLLHICLDRKSNSAADKLKLLEFFMIAQNGSWTLTFTSHFTQLFGVPSIDLFASRLNMVHLLLMPFLLVGGNIFFFTFSLIGFYRRWKPTKPPGY